MGEFCVKHGEGKKWYLQAKNYSDDPLSDLRRRPAAGARIKALLLPSAFPCFYSD